MEYLKKNKTVRKLILILILILSSCASNKMSKLKEIDFSLWVITKELNSKNLEFIALKKYRINDTRIYKLKDKANGCENCIGDYATYIFWNEKNKSYVQKFDNCSEFNKISISEFNAIEYLENNRTQLKVQSVQKYKISDSSYISINHPYYRYRNYWINDGGETYYKRFDSFDLTTREDEPNINFNSNNSLKLVILNKTLDSIIEKLEEGKKITRNKKTCYNTVYN